MKRIVRNYVVRDPKPIMDAILRGVSNYNAINIKPSIKGQTIFDEIKVNINDVEKTELYVNGLRYVVNTDYNIEDNKLIWLGDFDLTPDFDLVLIAR